MTGASFALKGQVLRRRKKGRAIVLRSLILAVAATAAAAFLLAHHHRRTLFEFVYADGQPADDIFVDRRLAFDFGDGFARRFDRQHRVMTLAVLRDLVGELLQAPGFGLVDRALIFADEIGRAHV